jgi:hypothetical protein
VLAARAPGRRTWQTSLTIENDASTVTVAIPELEKDAALAPSEAGAERAVPANARVVNSSVSGPSRINGGVIAGGVATGVFAVGALVTSILYKGKLSDYDAANHLDNNDRAASDLRSQVQTRGALNLALLGGTVVAAGVTVVLWATASPHEASGSARVELRGLVTPGTAGVSLGAKL